MGFWKWLLSTVVVDPLIMLALWNVLIVPMFRADYTTFGVCFWISVVINSIAGLYKLANRDTSSSWY
jgi:hypothetical protein